MTTELETAAIAGDTQFVRRSVVHSAELRSEVWEVPDLEFVVACLFGDVDPALFITLTREPADFYWHCRRRLVDLRHVDMRRVQTNTADVISRQRDSVEDHAEHEVLLVAPGLGFGLGRAFQTFIELRGRKIEVATTIEECGRLLDLDLGWYRDELALHS